MYEIYTDGSYKQGRGSWAYVIIKNGILIQEGSGRAKKTSSHRMEFQAAIEALRNFPLSVPATLYSDSNVLIQTINIKMPQWSSNDWLKKNGLPIPNKDQILKLYELLQPREVSWKWIKAHSGIPWNEHCDQLCLVARSLT